MNFWRLIEWKLWVIGGKPMYLKLAALGVVVLAAQIAGSIPIHDPWFLIFVGSMVFSAVTSGMPEPDHNSAKGYIWAYRTMHLLAAMGTSYFSNRSAWPALQPKASALVPPDEPKQSTP